MDNHTILCIVVVLPKSKRNNRVIKGQEGKKVRAEAFPTMPWPRLTLHFMYCSIFIRHYTHTTLI